MSSSHRNPKELKSLIQNCKSENFIDDIEMFEELTSLRHISNEEKTELGMMKSRVEEQSRLIMILKKSGDEYLTKNAVLENLNKDLSGEIETLKQGQKEIEDKSILIKQRFKTLSDYNEEIIKFKDDYKSKNVKLNAEIDELKKKMNDSAEAKKFAILKDELENKINALNEKCEQHDKNLININLKNEKKITNINRAHEEATNELNDSWEKIQKNKDLEIASLTSQLKMKDNEFLSFKSEIEKNKKEFLSLKNKLDNKDSQHDAKIKEIELTLEKTKAEFDAKSSKFSIHINQVTAEKLHNASQCKKLTEENKILTEKSKFLESQIEELEEELNESTIVEQKKRYAALKSEFSSYKIYANTLIEKEKEVNEKLRFLMG